MNDLSQLSVPSFLLLLPDCLRDSAVIVHLVSPTVPELTTATVVRIVQDIELRFLFDKDEQPNVGVVDSFCEQIDWYLELFPAALIEDGGTEAIVLQVKSSDFSFILLVPNHFPIIEFSLVSGLGVADQIASSYNNSLIDPVTLLPRVLQLLAHLSAPEVQRLISLLLQKRMITLDMLRALIYKMQGEGDKILRALSANIKRDLQESATLGAPLDRYWVDQALFLIAINLNRLVIRGGSGFTELRPLMRLHESLRSIRLSRFFDTVDFMGWVEKLESTSLLSLAAVNGKTIDWGRAASRFGEPLFEILRSVVSRRNYLDIMEEQKLFQNNYSQVRCLSSCFSLVEIFRELYFTNIQKELPDLDWYITHIDRPELLFSLLIENGAAEFVLALKGVSYKNRELLLAKMPQIARSVVRDLLRGTLVLNTPYGEKSEKEAAFWMRKKIYSMHEEGMLSITKS